MRPPKADSLYGVKSFQCHILNLRDHQKQSALKTSAQNAMKLQSTLLLALLSTTLVFGQLQQRDRTTREPRKGEPVEERRTRTRDRQQRSVGYQGHPEKMMKVFDFSADSDHEPDSNSEYTSAQ